MYRIYHLLLEPIHDRTGKPPPAAVLREEVISAAYHAAIGFRTRMDMADAAADVELAGHAELRARWGELLAQIETQRLRRNMLAHWSVHGSRNEKRELYLGPSSADKRAAKRIGGQVPEGITRDDLVRMQREWRQLATSLMMFWRALHRPRTKRNGPESAPG